MIYIGVTGWGDHDTLYENISLRDKLKEYGAHFPIVEVDTTFYAVQPVRNAEKWVRETPENFKFIVKAYQGITGHQRGEIPFETKEDMFRAFKDSLLPYVKADKLAMVLLQFPPWYDCKKEHVAYIRYCREQLKDFPLALEFRHQSWFRPEYREKTLSFMGNEGWIHSICDEPQAGEGSVPRVLEATHKEATLIRFHGRNLYGWNKPNGEDWREVRYLYRYNRAELEEWIPHIHRLHENSKDLYILFNNNSGGDAAANAKELIELLGIEYDGLAPKQLDLF
ncbi:MULTISPECIES: DUF72 domain-containing protein [Bacillaceae]|uniref:DUF72 domain-containing protein n=1 Tax=Bacillaceae TaxID=186817 RepID=UPI001C589E01|nr:DUF72 domain-containing protein [Rossellomorea sp. YZS02]MBW3111058.1 DUF72 domain-containing protein [Bacillus sp. MCCB 382]MDX8344193.1 DUF72 domain-containing protein [Rossellomorea sp. YZS02]